MDADLLVMNPSLLLALVRRRVNDPRLNRDSLKTALHCRTAGLTLRVVACMMGVHVATLCRWQKRSPELHAAFDRAAEQARECRRRAPRPRPAVYWRKDCPLCRARVVVRKMGAAPFWRCGRWPLCEWASWRPRAPRDCPRCGSPRYWSHSRKSVACAACGLRTRRPLTTATKSDESAPFTPRFGLW